MTWKQWLLVLVGLSGVLSVERIGYNRGLVEASRACTRETLERNQRLQAKVEEMLKTLAE